MKKALFPLLWIVAAVVLLAAGAYFYEQKWGADGPFPDRHHGSAAHTHDEHCDH